MTEAHEKEVETSTSLNALHGRLVELSEEYLHYEIADDHSDFSTFPDYARTCLIEVPGQVARYLRHLANETDDERLSALADDITKYQHERTKQMPLSSRAASCVAASKQINNPAPRPLPATLAAERS